MWQKVLDYLKTTCLKGFAMIVVISRVDIVHAVTTNTVYWYILHLTHSLFVGQWLDLKYL